MKKQSFQEEEAEEDPKLKKDTNFTVEKQQETQKVKKRERT